MLASWLESTGALLTILTPLFAVPLTVITFYLRSLREHQVCWHAELIRRVEAIEASVLDLRKAFGEFERDYTTKEEWLRECMLARRTLEQLTETTVRIETRMQGAAAGSIPQALTRRARNIKKSTNHVDAGDPEGHGEGSA